MINTLQPHGFEIINNDDDDTSIELECTRYITPKREKPIAGISRIQIQFENKSLTITAEIGKLVKILKVMYSLGVIIEIFFLIIIGRGMIKQGKPIQDFLLICALLITSAIIGIPMMKIMMKAQATKSLNELLKNMVTLNE